MNIRSIAIAAALTVSAAMAVTAVAGKPIGYIAKTARGEAASQIVLKWSGYVQQVYGISPAKWASAMRASFAQADLRNMQRAAGMSTYEGMMATLMGQQVTDDKIIDKLAKSDGSLLAVQFLGSPASDLVYTAIQPCRLADTRLAGGPISTDGTRDFDSTSVSFASQGGSETDCNMPADPSAILVNITVVAPAAQGYLTVYPYGTDRPLASALNYLPGEIKGNMAVVKQSMGLEHDFSVYANGGTDVVIDVVGYYMAPAAAALDCTLVGGTQAQVYGGATYNVSATCPSGYIVAGGGLRVPNGSYDMSVSESYPQGSDWIVRGKNTGATQQTVQARVNCCRVPGR